MKTNDEELKRIYNNLELKIVPNDMLCHWHTASREQRKHEIERGEGLDGTKNFQDIGCYDCGGYHFLCKMYLNLK